MKKRTQGFTLVEVAIVMVIIAFILAASITPLSTQIERSRIQETQLLMNDVMEALYGYAATWGRLPCPATVSSAGRADPEAGGACTLQHGFVPASTLGLTGEYNRDFLLMDAWGNPIRYSITSANAGAYSFTTPGQMAITGRNNLLPDLVICATASANATSCSNGDTLASNAVVVLLSLGKDGKEAVTGADQLENAGENAGANINSIAYPAVVYEMPANNVFVAHAYSAAAGSSGAFNDIVIWMPPYTLYDRMANAGQL